MLKKYSELTEAQQKLVQLMYSNADTVGQYLYNFDATGKYTGRQFAPETGVIHAEAAVEKIAKAVEHQAEKVIKKSEAKRKK